MTDLQVRYQQTLVDQAKVELEKQKLAETARANRANEAVKQEQNRLQQYADMSKYGVWYADQEAAKQDRGYNIARWYKDAGDMVSNWSPFSIKI